MQLLLRVIIHLKYVIFNIINLSNTGGITEDKLFIVQLFIQFALVTAGS